MNKYLYNMAQYISKSSNERLNKSMSDDIENNLPHLTALSYLMLNNDSHAKDIYKNRDFIIDNVQPVKHGNQDLIKLSVKSNPLLDIHRTNNVDFDTVYSYIVTPQVTSAIEATNSDMLGFSADSYIRKNGELAIRFDTIDMIQVFPDDYKINDLKQSMDFINKSNEYVKSLHKVKDIDLEL